MSWTSFFTSDGERTYRRPLGATEFGFYWDSIFSGVGDALLNVEIEVSDPENVLILGIENLRRTWIYMKHNFPLLGCSVEEREDSSGVDFVLQESRIRRTAPNEITLLDINSHSEVEKFNETIVNGPRNLSSVFLSRIWIIRRTDMDGHFHLLFHIAHVINDGIANAMMLRTFFDILSSPSSRPLPRLQNRLRFAASVEYMYDSLYPNLPRRRWRRAIGNVLFKMRRSRLQGGHTLPRTIENNTFFTPARSKLTTFYFPKAVSSQIIASCRKADITFGHAFPVISQLAYARLFHRRRISGKIKDSEWEYRKTQPMIFEGPLNIRPHLCPDLFNTQNCGPFSAFCGFYATSLPFMPTVNTSEDYWDDGSPSLSRFLSKEKFLSRSRSVKRQSINFLKHPLFLELVLEKNKDLAEGRKQLALQWRKFQVEGLPTSDHLFPQIPGITKKDCTLSNDGSSIGNLDTIFPQYYPLRRQTKSVLRATMTTNRFRCRPAELYLGSFMTSQRLTFFIFWDGNVYEENLIDEWLKELVNATKWYLGSNEASAIVDVDCSFYEKARL